MNIHKEEKREKREATKVTFVEKKMPQRNLVICMFTTTTVMITPDGPD